MKNPRPRWILPIALAGIWVASFHAASGQRPYTATSLDTDPGASGAEPWGIDKFGRVVGSAVFWFGVGGYVRAFLWTDGVMTELGTLEGSQAGPQSGASAISPSGHVVGWSYAVDGLRPFLWRDGVMIEVNTLGTWSSARAVNDSDQVVGDYSADPTYSTNQAFLWQNGVMIDLGTFGGSVTSAWGINAAGHVVGYSLTPAGQPRPFLWQNGTMTELSTLGFGGGYAYAINDSGQVAGSVGAAMCLTDSGVWSYDYHAVRWDNGVLVDLGNLGCGRPTYATSINNAGQVVGGVDACDSSGSCYPASAFLHDGCTMTDLNNLAPGLGLAYATGINDAGQIATNSLNSGGYRLDPVVVPSPMRHPGGSASARCWAPAAKSVSRGKRR